MADLMKCGHAANGSQVLADGTTKRVCVSCAGLGLGAEEVADEQPKLDGRRAKCSSCPNETDSSMNLPFFGYAPDREKDLFYCGCYGWD
jgi:hypothetical protein